MNFGACCVTIGRYYMIGGEQNKAGCANIVTYGGSDSTSGAHEMIGGALDNSKSVWCDLLYI